MGKESGKVRVRVVRARKSKARVELTRLGRCMFPEIGYKLGTVQYMKDGGTYVIRWDGHKKDHAVNRMWVTLVL
jgi:hypothetical protein